MDFKDAKTQKIALGVLAFFIVVYFWHSRLYSRYESQINLKSQEFETLTTNLRNVELKAKSLDALSEEYDGLMMRYHEIEALLPEVKQIPSFLVQLHTASSLTGTKIKRIMPQPVIAESFYNITSFQIEMTGTYHDVGAFMSYVSNFPFITNVSDFTVKALNTAITNTPVADDDHVDLTQKKETITTAFNLSTYFVRADERIKELVL
ncbi:MAG: type 4a pilus biogenesis protein PilO [Candidatus Zixiibacteriota bacterium]